MIGYYLTHPQIVIDPSTPVPDWSISPAGAERVVRALNHIWWRQIGCILASDERKAVETAAIISKVIGAPLHVWPDMGENNRASTGFLPPDQFEHAADAFFAEPEISWRGWETAAAAQRRIVASVEASFAAHAQSAPVLYVGHGAVGTLLKCAIGDRPISRSEDQKHGGGNIFAFTLDEPALLCDWTTIELFEGIS